MVLGRSALQPLCVQQLQKRAPNCEQQPPPQQEVGCPSEGGWGGGSQQSTELKAKVTLLQGNARLGGREGQGGSSLLRESSSG